MIRLFRSCPARSYRVCGRACPCFPETGTAHERRVVFQPTFHMRGEVGTASEHLARWSPSRPVGLATYPSLTLPSESLPSNADPVFERSSVAEREVELAARGIDRERTRWLSCWIGYRCASRLIEVHVLI